MLTTVNGYFLIQGGTAAKETAPATSQAQATTAQDAQRINSREFREQIREQARAAAAAAAEARDQAADVQVHVPPIRTDRREFTIQGPNGERTVIGVPPANEIIPPQAVDISIAFFLMVAAIIIGLPIARAFARRMDRKSAGPQIPREVSDQLVQINQAVDAIALEVERISEGQRYTTRLLSEQRDPVRQTLPSGAQR